MIILLMRKLVIKYSFQGIELKIPIEITTPHDRSNKINKILDNCHLCLFISIQYI